MAEGESMWKLMGGLLALPVLQSRLFMHNISFCFAVSRKPVISPCSQSP